MEFSEVLRRRRMVRNYLPDPVPDHVLVDLVGAGRRAPSAGHSQGQSFVIITDPERRRVVADLAGEPAYVARGFDPWLSTAPAHIVVCTSEQLYRERYAEADKGGSDRHWTVPYWWVDAGASMMAILLAAVDAGLGAGFLGAHAIPGLATALDLPPTVTPIGLITVGVPAPDRPSSSIDRGARPDGETLHWQRWSSSESGACNTGPVDGT
jgi:FMN reductase [NAD(P)H]